LPTRGYVRGIGRGQTHKAQIIHHWLQGKTYDQLELQTRHSESSIKRYIQTFVRVVQLLQRGYSQGEVALLLQIGVALVKEYQEVYRKNDQPECRKRLDDQMQRILQPKSSEKREKRGAL
jgi:hypothetical protein